MPSDTLCSFKIRDLLEFYVDHKGVVTVVREMRNKMEIAGRLGCAVMKNEQIIEFSEKPKNPPSLYAAIPFYVYPKDVLKKVKEYYEDSGKLREKIDAPGLIIPWLIQKNIPVYAFKTEKPTLDIGKPEDIDKVSDIFTVNNLSLSCCLQKTSRLSKIKNKQGGGDG